MAYLLDTNSLFDAKNLWYRFDICPGFWEWILIQNRRGIIYSVEAVKDECKAGNDLLSKWVTRDGKGLFLSPDIDVINFRKEINAWVMQQTHIDEHVRTKFIAKADPFLIAHGKIHGHTIVTHEDKGLKALKIPAVCHHYQMPETITLYKLIGLIGGKFILDLESVGIDEYAEDEEDEDFGDDEDYEDYEYFE